MDNIKKLLVSGKYYVPETVSVQLPFNESALKEYLTWSTTEFNVIKNSSKDWIKKESTNEDYLISPDDQLYFYINPVASDFFDLILKKTTYKNNWITNLVNNKFSNRTGRIDLPNKGWRINGIKLYTDIMYNCTRKYSTDNDEIVVELYHPDLFTLIKRKFGYDLNNYKNLSIITVVNYEDLQKFVIEFDCGFLYGKSTVDIKFINPTIDSYLNPNYLINRYVKIIPEDYYQENKDSSLKIADSLGKKSSVLDISDDYIPGHIYTIKELNSKLDLTDDQYFYMLYIGKIDLLRYPSIKQSRPMKSNVLTNRYSIPEYSEWTSDTSIVPRAGKGGNYSSGRYWGDLNIPVDIFIPIYGFYRFESNPEIPGELMGVIENGNPLSESDLQELRKKKYKMMYATCKDKLSSSSDRINSRFVVLPATTLTNNCKGHYFEDYITPPSTGKRSTSSESELLTSYRHFTIVRDLGKFVDISSSAKTFIKNQIIDIEGSISDYCYQLFKYGNTSTSYYYYGGYQSPSKCGGISLDAFNLFTKEDLDALSADTLNNLRLNVASTILSILLDYGVYYCYWNCDGRKDYLNQYRNIESLTCPIFDKVNNEFLLGYQKSLDNVKKVTELYSNTRIHSNEKKERDVRTGIYNVIINYLFSPDIKHIKYSTNGILNTIEKFSLTPEIFKQCAEYQN